MMATYPPHVGGMQPGMPHGVPGMPPGTGQPMGHPMQMNANVSGAGNPHMAQAGAMMGMQPGVGGMPGGMGGQGPGAGMGMPGQNMGGPGANAMAMGHLNPQANMIQQQQQQQHQQQLQQQMQNNPHLFAQQQQQQQAAMIRQRQMMQQHMAMGGGPGGQMGLTPQQIAQLQSNPNFHAATGLQPHQLVQLQQMQVQRSQQAQLQQQQQQQHAQQQAQQHAAQQAQQAQQQAQQQQQPPLQQQQQQTPGAAPQGQGPNGPQNMAHHVAMQHAPSQTSNHSAAGVQPGQPGATGQMRAQSQAPTGPDGAAPAQTPQPLQQNQPNQQQGQQGQQAAQQNPQGQNLNASQMQQQMRQQQLMLQFQRQQQASQAAAAAAAAQSRVQGTFILKLLSFSDHLSSFSTKDRSNDIEFWQNFVHKFFAPDGRLVMYLPTSPERRPKQFTVPNSTLARYWWTYFNSGLQNLQVKMENAKENALQNGGHYVAFERTQFVFWYTNGVQVIWHGKLNAMFPAGIDRLEVLEFELSNYDEYIPKTEVARVVSTMGSPTMTRSPKLNKNGPKQRQMSKIKGIEPITLEDFASAPINQSGCPMPVMQFLEIGETFYMMHSLMQHAQKTSLRPAEALMSVVKMFDEQAAAAQPDMAAMQAAFQPPNPPMNLQLPPQRQASLAAGGRTPMQAQMQLPQGNAFSPQVANMNLPMQMAHLNGPMAGSPHMAQNPQLNMIQQQQQQGQTGSPGSMAAPNMIPQHSAQGSTSTGASTNTSPNVAAKRRRSQVKVEDENGAEVNGRVKASPRIGGGPNKKAKA